jgi:hypothetical protein
LLDLLSSLGIPQQFPDWDRDLGLWLRRQARSDAGFVTAWAIQARLSGIMLLAILALVSFWVALVVMLAWGIVATIVYFHARERGAPDLIELPTRAYHRAGAIGRTMHVGVRLFGLLVIGIPALLYTRLAPLADRVPVGGTHSLHIQRISLFFGLTFFGVTTAHHILRRSGYSGSSLLRLSCLGSCLNVGYRVLAGAFVLNLVTHIVTLPV